jgi:DnaJ-class molecular chaperone
MGKMYQPKTGQRCACKPGVHRSNCSNCEGTGWVIDFRAIRVDVEKHRQTRLKRSEDVVE